MESIELNAGVERQVERISEALKTLKGIHPDFTWQAAPPLSLSPSLSLSLSLSLKDFLHLYTCSDQG